MPAGTSATADFELQAPDGTWMPFSLLLEVNREGVRQPKSFSEAIAAQTADAPLSEWLEPFIRESFAGGIGIDYDVALGCDAFTSPGYVFPGGAATDVVLPAASNSSSPIVAFAELQDSFWCAQRGTGAAGTARLMVSTNKTGTGSGAFQNGLQLTAGEYFRDLLVAPDHQHVLRLYATSSDVDGNNGRLHRWLGGAANNWASTPLPGQPGSFGANGRNRMVSVWWQDQDAVGAVRLVTLSSNAGHISYTRPEQDPMDALSWIEHVATGTSQPGGELVAARRRVWINGRDNLFDLDELGNSPALTGYTALHEGNGQCVAYHNGFVYRSLGQGLDRVDVSDSGVLQEAPGLCTPGYLTRAESGHLVGWATALQPWNGGILCAMFSLIHGRPGIYWGKDRREVGVETPNPLVWHGPFAWAENEAATVTRMAISETPLPSLTRLWAATWTTSQNAPPKLSWISLPTSGGAFANLRANGSHRYARGAPGSGSIWQQSSQLHLLPQTLGDKGSVKHLYQHTYGSLNLSRPDTNTQLRVYTRADPPPDSLEWGAAASVTESPTQTITPTDVVSGNKLQHRIDLFSPQGDATPPIPAVLDSIRTTCFRTAPDVDTWTLDVEYGPGVIQLTGGDWGNRGISVQQQTDALLEVCRGGRTILRDRSDRRWSVKVKHALPRVRQMTNGVYGERMQARLVVANLGQL
jgi:hypothetical protein